MNRNELRSRTKKFAHACVKFACKLPKNHPLFVRDENLLPAIECDPLLKEAKELTRIFISSRMTIQRNL